MPGTPEQFINVPRKEEHIYFTAFLPGYNVVGSMLDRKTGCSDDSKAGGQS